MSGTYPVNNPLVTATGYVTTKERKTKMAKNKIPCCPKCGLPLEKETELGIDYPYVCKFCDEDFYELEAVYLPKSEVPKLTKYEKELHITNDSMVEVIVELNDNGCGRGLFVSGDYIGRIADKIVKAVMQDVWETADRDNWNDDDVRLAIGRVLCDKLHCNN